MENFKQVFQAYLYVKIDCINNYSKIRHREVKIVIAIARCLKKQIYLVKEYMLR